jgi:hypothetical protein
MNKEVKNYIEKQKSPQKEICMKLHRIILKTLPEIKNEMRYGAPWYEKYYIGAFRDSVNLGFSVKGLLKKEMALFSGAGRIMRHVKIKSLKDINEKQIVKLLKLVYKKTKDCSH